MVSSVTPMSDASFAPPPPPPPPPPFPPPQAATVETTVAAARKDTRRREDLDNSSPLVRPGLRCPGVWWGEGGGTRRLDRVVLTARSTRGPPLRAASPGR